MANFTASEEPIVSPSHYPSFCTHHKRLRLISALLSAKLSSFLVGFARLFRRISLRKKGRNKVVCLVLALLLIHSA